MISHLDHAIGRIHQTLERRSQAESTLVIHIADHGLAVGRHGLMGKQNLYEHSVRVPLLLRGPNVPRGQQREALCYQHDLFPTLCEAAQIPIPAANEFQSLWPLIESPSAQGRSSLFSAYENVQRMVKDEQWKLIEYFAPAERRTQLFDWKNDPHELDDLSGAPSQRKRVLRLRAELAQWQRRLDDPLLLHGGSMTDE